LEKQIPVRFAASMASRSRYPDSGLAVALAIYLGVYVGLAVCFAAGLNWLMRPSVFPNAGLAAYKPPPSTIVTMPFSSCKDAASAAGAGVHGGRRGA
jgi:hypothetical protein